MESTFPRNAKTVLLVRGSQVLGSWAISMLGSWAISMPSCVTPWGTVLGALL